MLLDEAAAFDQTEPSFGSISRVKSFQRGGAENSKAENAEMQFFWLLPFRVLVFSLRASALKKLLL